MKHKLIEPIVGGPTPDHLIVAVDFDGTICQHPGRSFPAIGAPVPHAITVLKRLQDAGHKLMLWTMRNGEHAADAVQYLADNGIVCWGCNENPQQSWSGSHKQYAHLYIDDAALGCPLVHPAKDRAFVDWWKVERFLEKALVLTELEYPEHKITYLMARHDFPWTVDAPGDTIEDAISWIRHHLHPAHELIIQDINGKPYQQPEPEGGVTA